MLKINHYQLLALIGVEKKIYTEKHHIFPKSIFGENNILVSLMPKEHFIAHHLLWRYYRKRYGPEHWKTIKMLHAVHKMIFIQGRMGSKKINSRTYQSIKEEYGKVYCGKNHHSYGKILSDEQLIKISESTLGKKKTLEHIKNISSSQSKNKRAVLRINILDQNDIKEYESISDAIREGFVSGNIYNCLNNKNEQKTHRGYYWLFKYEKIIPQKKQGKRRVEAKNILTRRNKNI